ncbi:MAG: hypothetical protein ACLS48_11730 [[Eubacterium] siraeum]
MAETYISIEKIRSLAEVGTIDEFKDSTDMNEIFARLRYRKKNTLVLSLMTNSLPPPQSLQRAGLPR